MHGFTSAALLALLPATLLAQAPEPKRPQLFAGADTNDASLYHDYGLQVMRSRPDVAANAFYWAARLNPTRGDAFYARRVALLLTDRRRLMRYWSGERSTLRSAEIKRIDSLYLHALTLNPFLYEALDRHLLDAVIGELSRSETGERSLAMTYALEEYLKRAGDGSRAWQAYTAGNFPSALDLYGRAVKSARYKYGIRSMRGRIFFQLAKYDSALTELQLAVDEVRKRDAKDFVYVYESKALYEQAVGMAHEQRGDTAAARAAYGRALQEDLAYSPAHVRLAFLAIEAKDTTNALGSFDLAVQLRPEDPGLRHQYGYVLGMVGKHAEALEQLDKAIAQNPWYAASYLARGTSLEALGRKPDAVEAFKLFLTLAPRNDPRRQDATQRLQALGAGAD